MVFILDFRQAGWTWDQKDPSFFRLGGSGHDLLPSQRFLNQLLYNRLALDISQSMGGIFRDLLFLFPKDASHAEIPRKRLTYVLTSSKGFSWLLKLSLMPYSSEPSTLFPFIFAIVWALSDCQWYYFTINLLVHTKLSPVFGEKIWSPFHTFGANEYDPLLKKNSKNENFAYDSR